MAEQLVFDYRLARLSAADRALCDFAVKLTLAPAGMNGSDVAALRAHGLSDEAIAVAAQVVAYFNYINRIADGLGVELEAWMTLPKDEWERRRGRDFPAT